MDKLFHIISKDDLQRALSLDYYAAESLEVEGFIHLAYENQLAKIIKLFFAGAKNIYLLELDPSQLNAEVIDEAPVGIDNDGELYPHLYGPINRNAISGYQELVIDNKGCFTNAG